MQHQYQCPHCLTNTPPQVVSSISSAGWVFFIIFLFICFPIAFLGFTMKEEHRVCPICGTNVGEATRRIAQGAERQLRAQSEQAGVAMPYVKQVWIAIVCVAVIIPAVLYLSWVDKRNNAPPANSNLPAYLESPMPSPSPSPTPVRAQRKSVKPKPSPSNDPVTISTAPKEEASPSPHD